MKNLFQVLIVVLVFIALYEGKEQSIKHKCKWELCPYKDIKPKQWKESVKKYTECEEGSDGYEIDMLHLEFPELDYDALDSLLFAKTYTS